MINSDLRNWLVKGCHDLKASENEMNVDLEEILTDIICFHSQQAGEKFFKGLSYR